MNIDRAKAIRGWMNDHELWWLAEQAQKKTVIEIGCAWGRSTVAMADNSPNCLLFAVDTWNGSPNELESHHKDFKQLDGDAAYLEFYRNLWPYIVSGFVIPLRMHSINAATLLVEKGVYADFVFIDGCHDAPVVEQDIRAYLPLVREGGILAGHDYNDPKWPGINKAIDSVGLSIECPLPHIWMTKL